VIYFEEVAEGEVGSGPPAPLPPVEEEEDGSPTKKKVKRKKKEEPEEEEYHQSADPAAGLPQVHGTQYLMSTDSQCCSVMNQVHGSGKSIMHRMPHPPIFMCTFVHVDVPVKCFNSIIAESCLFSEVPTIVIS
jgi:hypothetical protein